MMISLADLLLWRIVFAILIFVLVFVVVVIPDEFENCSFQLYEELIQNFDGDCIESVDCFWQDGDFYCTNSANP